MFLQGYGYRKIKKHLENYHIKTVTGKDRWSTSTIDRILSNEKYVGHVLLQKTYVNNKIETSRNLPDWLIIHSDRGSQYTSHEYRNKIKELNIKQSFSAKGCPYDNAPIESFHAILKKELVHRRVFKNFEQAKIEIFKYIESRYNRNRIHSALGYITPQQAEDNFKNVA